MADEGSLYLLDSTNAGILLPRTRDQNDLPWRAKGFFGILLGPDSHSIGACCQRDSGRRVADSETMPAPCGSSSDVGGHLAGSSATRTSAEDLQRPRQRTGSPETAIRESALAWI